MANNPQLTQQNEIPRCLCGLIMTWCIIHGRQDRKPLTAMRLKYIAALVLTGIVFHLLLYLLVSIRRSNLYTSLVRFPSEKQPNLQDILAEESSTSGGHSDEGDEADLLRGAGSAGTSQPQVSDHLSRKPNSTGSGGSTQVTVLLRG